DSTRVFARFSLLHAWHRRSLVRQSRRQGLHASLPISYAVELLSPRPRTARDAGRTAWRARFIDWWAGSNGNVHELAALSYSEYSAGVVRHVAWKRRDIAVLAAFHIRSRAVGPCVGTVVGMLRDSCCPDVGFARRRRQPLHPLQFYSDWAVRSGRCLDYVLGFPVRALATAASRIKIVINSACERSFKWRLSRNM